MAHFLTLTLIFAGDREKGLYRSEDSGATWLTQTTGLLANDWITSLAIHPITPTILYAGTWDGQVYRNTDGGDL